MNKSTSSSSTLPLIPMALVTGASSGIGQAIAVRLAQDGFHVLIHYNSNESGAQETLRIIQDYQKTGEIIQFNISDNSSVESSLDKYFEDEKNKNKRFAALVNNAGIHHDTLCGIMTDEIFDNVIKTNLYGTFYLLRFATKKMLRHRNGSIVNVASISGQTGNAGQINYSASKGGILAMTKSLAKELGSKNIRVNAIAPGVIETDMIKDNPYLEAMKKQIPLKRFGKTSEISGAVSFLCSEDASYITGHTISINGGLY